MIQTTDLTKSFGEFTAVNGLTLTVKPGTIFGFLGPNGAGKTTTLRMITGLLRPTSGTATVAGYDVAQDSQKVKRVTGYLPDNPFLYDHLTIAEFLTFVGDVYEVPAGPLRERSEAYLKLFELDSRGGQRISELSLGMRKKVALTALLARQPQVLFLDEPTSGLDPRAVKSLRELLERLAGEGMTIFFSTHILEVAQRISHTMGIISRGHLVACGTMDELRNKAQTEDRDLEEIFLSLTAEGEDSRVPRDPGKEGT